MIVEGDLVEGQRINETDLCSILDVSRTPLREALKVLASEGLVELRAHRGSEVTRVTPEAVHDLFETVSGLERHGAELAAKRATERDLKRLRTLHEKMSGYFLANDRRAYFALNHRIHELIIGLAGNEVLKSVHASLMVRLRRARYKALYSEERWRESVEEHLAILEALEAHDPDAAGMLLQRHVQRTGDILQLELAAAARRSEKTSDVDVASPIALESLAG